MKTLAVLLAAALLALPAQAATPVGRLVLRDGRVIKNAILRSYDAPSSKVLVLSDGKALLIPVDLLPPAYAEKVREASKPAADLVQTTPVPSSPAPADSAAPETKPAAPAAPAPATPVAAPADPAEAHMAAATAHARRYYKYEHRIGSNSVAVSDSDIAIDETEPVSGWTGRYRTTGKAYLEIYDSIGGGSFRRAVRRFEVLTEQKPGEPIKVVGFSSR